MISLIAYLRHGSAIASWSVSPTQGAGYQQDHAIPWAQADAGPLAFRTFVVRKAQQRAKVA
jgi:hypothetical protein